MAKIFFLLLGLMFSQWLVDVIRSSSPSRSAAGWTIGFVAQYICCLVLVMWFDHVALSECLRAGLILTCFVRWFYFMKRLK